ncbi:MAG: class I SAM-dependent methyltransferase [Betaproteobacteria bacterium]|nr:class I SAM-dependent methyltransferase [Betaproteobacteria bacterium]
MGVRRQFTLHSGRDVGFRQRSLIGIDPAQHDGTWRGGGLYNIERAGFSDRYTFHEAASQSVLPRLADAGTRIQFGFIDGWHTFDHTLVDFFYLDQMLDVGGVLVLDDVGYPSLQRLAHFVITNRAYSFLDSAERPVATGWRNTAKARAQQVFLPVVRDNHTPSEGSRLLQAPINRSRLIALQKTGNDERSFDHFVPF